MIYILLRSTNVGDTYLFLMATNEIVIEGRAIQLYSLGSGRHYPFDPGPHKVLVIDG